MNKLLDIKHDIDIVHVLEVTLVLPTEVEDYLNGNIDAPLLKPLRIFWDQVNHPWNGHLAGAFAEFLIQQKPELAEDKAAIEIHFNQRLDTLRKTLLAHIPREGEQTAEETSQRVKDRYQANRHDKRIRKRQKDVSIALYYFESIN